MLVGGLLDEMKELARGGNQKLTGNIKLSDPATFERTFVASAITDFC